MSAPGDTQTGLDVLIVEDEPLLVMLLEDMLETLGHRIAASCASVAAALEAIAAGGFDCAFVDLNLQGVSAQPVAAELHARGVPFAVASGSPVAPDEDEALRSAPFLAKPYSPDDLESALAAIGEVLAKGSDRER